MLDLFFEIIHVVSNMVGMCIEACRTHLNNHPNHVLFWIENENHKYVVVLLLHYQHLQQFIICIPSSVYFRPMSPSQFLHHVLLSMFLYVDMCVAKKKNTCFRRSFVRLNNLVKQGDAIFYNCWRDENIKNSSFSKIQSYCMY